MKTGLYFNESYVYGCGRGAGESVLELLTRTKNKLKAAFILMYDFQSALLYTVILLQPL